FTVAAEPNMAAEAAAANAASPAGEFGSDGFDGPKLLAKPVPPFSSLNAKTSPSASLETATVLRPFAIANVTCGGRYWVASKVTSAEVPTAPYIDASTATAGIVVFATCARSPLTYCVSVCVPALIALDIVVA